MNKIIFSVLIALLSGITPGFAQPSERSIIAELPHGKLVLERSAIPDGLAFNDSIVLEQGDEAIEVFESEGRAIQQVIHEDLDGDGIGELLIQMDLGGSGGYREFELLHFKEGVYLPVWLETGYAAGEASIEDRDGSGRKRVYIAYTDTDVEPQVEDTAVFEFTDGTLKRQQK
ncbi:MAG: hypothetical protein CVV42_03340 [Candidatus Riflebacteria bacterium HGW-Riflebacteria-2]|jgi:hypothetical protein|nr:MAG: hypothetical protein CVV42_03340 [Candidatus Riflebacteria bacterium HGW-Riflebacteria-2]